MPINQNFSFSDWILQYIQYVDIKINHFISIIYLGEERKIITIELTDLILKLDKTTNSFYSGKINSIKLFEGEKRNKIQICHFNDISFIFSENNLSININKIGFFLNENIILNLCLIIFKFLNDNSNNSNNFNFNFNLNIKKILFNNNN